jgi:hypothetical protein
MEQDHRRVKQRVRLLLGCKRLDYAAVSLAGIELIGGVPDVDMRLLKFWRINSLGTIASISRTLPKFRVEGYENTYTKEDTG